MWRGTTPRTRRGARSASPRRNSSNTRFVYTAGHCTTGNGINWGTRRQNIGPMGAVAGLGRRRRLGHPGHELVVHRRHRRRDLLQTRGISGWSPVKGVAPTVELHGRRRDGLPVGELHAADRRRQLVRRPRHEQRRRRARHGARRRPRRLRRRQRRRLVLAVLVGQPLRLRHPQPQRRRLPRRRRRHALLVHGGRERQGERATSPPINIETRPKVQRPGPPPRAAAGRVRVESAGIRAGALRACRSG